MKGSQIAKQLFTQAPAPIAPAEPEPPKENKIDITEALPEPDAEVELELNEDSGVELFHDYKTFYKKKEKEETYSQQIEKKFTDKKEPEIQPAEKS